MTHTQNRYYIINITTQNGYTGEKMTKSSYRTADGVYVEFWHDYKTAANLKKYCDRTAAKNGTTVVSINYRIAGEKLK